MDTTPVISIYLDTRRKNTKGLFPVKLRVYYNKNTRFYTTGTSLSEIDFKKSYLLLKPRNEFKDLKSRLVSIESKANEIIKDMKIFSFEKFERNMFRNTSDADDVFYYYKTYISKLEEEDRIGTASSYDLSVKSIIAFIKDKRNITPSHLSFYQITTDWLNQYERWMLFKKKSATTVGIYLRPLRALFHIAIREGDIQPDCYPFGKGKYQIPAGRNTKKSLNKDQLKTFYNHPVEKNSTQEKARDFWFLSYQCNGINIRDIAELKYKNIQDDKIIFNRNKTKNTGKANSKPIVVITTDNIWKIIRKYGNEKETSDSYVFPIFGAGMTEKEKVTATHNFTRFINQHIKQVAKDAKISEGISTYWARHSFTTTAIRNGASMEYIQESLGHQNMSTTQNYWAGFEENVKKDVAEKLMDFNDG